jgi:RNA polymerase sigma-70 factor, ECF subfamily
MPLIYSELHRMARLFLRNRRPGETLQPTALVNEAYLKLVDNGQPQFVDRAHFLAVMSKVMRQVLIDHARAAAAIKRGGQAQRVDWDTAIIVESAGSQSQLRILEIDRALEALSSENPTLARVVEMHYFGGMTAEEIALVAERSAHVIRHELRLARAWLRRELADR